MSKKLRGFTLIELLVVLFIIALLASLVIVNVSQARKSGRDAKRIANLKSIQTALEMYAEKNRGYPATATSITGTIVEGNRSGCLEGWCGLCSNYNTNGTFKDSGSSGWIAGLAPEFIPVLPQDPKQKDSEYCYLYRSDSTDYMVLAHGTMETCPTTGCGNSENVSIKEMARPRTKDQPTIAVYTSGASGW